MNITGPTDRSSASAPWFLLLLAVLAFFCFGYRTLSTSSIWMHLASGRVIAEDGRPQQDPFSFTTDATRPWINANWLYDLGVYKTWNVSGASGVVILHALLGLAAFLLAVRTSRLPFAHPAVAAALLLGGWLVAPVFQANPLLPALCFMGLFLSVLDAHGGRARAWSILVPVQILWTQMHGTFLIGPVLAALFVLQAWLEQRRSAPGAHAFRPLLALAVTLLVVTVLNPYGLGLHQHVVGTLTNPQLGVLIEWISPFQSEFAPAWPRHASTLALILVALGFIFIRDRLPLAVALCAVAGAFFIVASPRYAALSGLLVTPFVALSLAGLARVLAQRMQDQPAKSQQLARVARLALLAVSLLTVVYLASNRYYVLTGSASAFGRGISRELLPTAACERLLSRPDFPDRTINLAMDGGYLAWRLPGHKVFTDPRVSVYGSVYYQGLARALLGQPEAWSNLVQRIQPNAVLLNGSWPGAGSALRRLVDDKEWALVYFDGISSLLVRRLSQHQGVLDDQASHRAGLADLEAARQDLVGSSSTWRVPALSPRLMGAGAAYLALGRFTEAKAVYDALMPHAPRYTTGWLNLGLCELQLRQFDRAIQALQTATVQRPDAPLPWLWLGKAYEVSGRPTEAAAAMQKATLLSPGIVEAFAQNMGSSTNPPAPASAP